MVLVDVGSDWRLPGFSFDMGVCLNSGEQIVCGEQSQNALTDKDVRHSECRFNHTYFVIIKCISISEEMDCKLY